MKNFSVFVFFVFVFFVGGLTAFSQGQRPSGCDVPGRDITQGYWGAVCNGAQPQTPANPVATGGQGQDFFTHFGVGQGGYQTPSYYQNPAAGGYYNPNGTVYTGSANWGLRPGGSNSQVQFGGADSELKEFVSRTIAREMLLKTHLLVAREEQANLVANIFFEKNGNSAVVHITWRDYEGTPKALGEGKNKNGDFREAAREAAKDSARQMGRVVNRLFIPDLP